MKCRLPAALLASLLLPLAAVAPAHATDGPALAVDVTLDRWPISPDVYGMNFADPALEAELGLSLSRWGGNATSRYNWTNNTTNLGADWYFENYVKPADESLDATVKASWTRGTRTLVTLPMTGWVSKTSPVNHPWYCGFSVARYGPQRDVDDWEPDCGDGVKATGGNVTGNDPLDTSVAAGPAFVQSMVAHLKETHGAGVVRTYGLDNEPSLWNSTHRDVHPAAVTYDELRDKSVATAKAVKAADAAAEVMGPSEWGWCAYYFSPADSGGCGDGPDRQAHGGTPIAQWYLQQFAAASQAAGTRLLDVFDEHYYPQAPGVTLSGAGDSATQARRLRSTRSLWDPSYVDESWIGTDVGAPPIRMIPWMRQLVAASYPGTRTAISEYNFGGLEHVNGALAQADVLGIFGRERLDKAMLWAPPTPSQPGAYAFRMYRSYDGAGSRFGETNVRATSGDQAKLAVYAAQRAADGALTVMVVNKTASSLTAPLSVGGAAVTTAKRYAYSATNAAAIRTLSDVALSSGAASVTYEPNSITLLVLPTSGAPAPAATSLTTGVTPSTVVHGTPVVVTGRLLSGVTGVAGRTVTLEAQRKGTSTWTSLGTATTAADGRLSKTVTPQWSAALRWRWAGDAAYAAATGSPVTVTVKGRVTTTLSPTKVARGGTAWLKGGVAPAHPYGKVSLQQWVTGIGWRTLGTVSMSSAGTYALSQRPSTAGTRRYRVLWVGDADHYANTGPEVTLTVT